MRELVVCSPMAGAIKTGTTGATAQDFAPIGVLLNAPTKF